MPRMFVAKDSNGHTQPVQNISKYEKWTCVECGESLIPKMGGVMPNFWVHRCYTNCKGGA